MSCPELKCIDISIHALREEGDLWRVRCGLCGRISIHALREEGDLQRSGHDARHFDFYPRPPRGGRRARRFAGQRPDRISIHALREEGDLRSSHSRRRAPGISIHALREEGD